MDDYRGIAILATTGRSALDRAFLRRLPFLVDFPFPDAPGRRLIRQKAFPPAAEVDRLELDLALSFRHWGGTFLTATDKARGVTSSSTSGS